MLAFRMSSAPMNSASTPPASPDAKPRDETASASASRTWQRVQQVLLGALTFDDQTVHPETVTAQHEQNDAVWQAVQSLGEKHRWPVILRYYHDLPVAEIAAVLGLSEGTVHSRLSIARDRLRLVLQPAPAPKPEVEPRWQR